MTYKTFSSLMRNKRIELKLTQKEASLKLVIQQSRYNRLEQGLLEPTFLELQRILCLYSLDFNEICEIKKPKEYSVYFD